MEETNAGQSGMRTLAWFFVCFSNKKIFRSQSTRNGALKKKYKFFFCVQKKFERQNTNAKKMFREVSFSAFEQDSTNNNNTEQQVQSGVINVLKATGKNETRIYESVTAMDLEKFSPGYESDLNEFGGSFNLSNGNSIVWYVVGF